MEGFIKAATTREIAPGERKLIEVEGTRIAIFNLDGEYHAIEDVCTHDGGPLVEGDIVNDGQVMCPRHGARFDIRTGAAVSMPAFTPTESFQVHVEGDEIWVESPW